MFPHTRYPVILLVAMVLTGCASTSHHGLDPAARSHLDPIAVHFTIPPFELTTSVAHGAGKDENAAALSHTGSPVVRDALEENALEIARPIADDVAGVATNMD